MLKIARTIVGEVSGWCTTAFCAKAGVAIGNVAGFKNRFDRTMFALGGGAVGMYVSDKVQTYVENQFDETVKLFQDISEAARKEMEKQEESEASEA
jgi:hypothetical protein